MPAPKKFLHDAQLPYVRRHITHTARELRSNPLTTSFAAIFDALLALWTTIFQTDLDLQDQVDKATSEERSVDSELNLIARRLWKEINLITGDDKDALLLKFYFEGKSLHVFIRPVLSGQLASMRSWPDSLLKSEHDSLKKIGQDLLPLIPKADAAVTAKADAEKKLDELRQLGARKLFIDEVNNKRKETYTDVSALQSKHPELTTSFVEGLFRRDRTREEDPTIGELEEEIKDLEELHADKKARLEKLKTEFVAAQLEKKKQKKEAAKKRLAEVNKELEEKQKEATKLAAEIEEEDKEEDKDE
jgi:hypothetical protein